MDPAGLPALEEAIRRLHACKPTFVESVPVRETFKGAVVWDGEVAVFNVKGHRSATRVYAWSHATEGAKRRFFAVLHEGAINSPVKAVRASIVADARKKWGPRFTVVAIDLPGIGDSSIPASGIDMTTSAKRIHEAVHKLGYERARVVGHDIGLMVAYAYAAQYPSEVESLTLMDAFLPGIGGWRDVYDAPNPWHFASTAIHRSCWWRVIVPAVVCTADKRFINSVREIPVPDRLRVMSPAELLEWLQTGVLPPDRPCAA